MSDRRYCSEDGRFSLLLPSDQIETMLFYCRKAKIKETGGVLVGHYTATHDCAVITNVAGPPQDSKASHTRFERGVRGLTPWLASLWNNPERRYYLGEWHFHPYSNPTPSRDDCTQMKDISASLNYRCPEPLLLILGGDPSGGWTLSVQVFASTNVPLRLSPVLDEMKEKDMKYYA